MRAVTPTSLKANMKYYFDLVSQSMDVIIVPRNNNDDEAVVIMSIKKYNSLKETEYILSTNANRKRISNSLKQAENDEVISYDN